MTMVEAGREGCRITVLIATASTPELPRVFREAASQTRDLPVWSDQEIFWNSILLYGYQWRPRQIDTSDAPFSFISWERID